MGILKLKRTTDEIPPQPLAIAEGRNAVSGQMETFTVLVRYRSRREEEQLFNRATTPKLNRLTGAMEPALDIRKWNSAAPDAYIAGFEGCTPAALRTLIALEEDPPTNAEGHVEYSPELAHELWAEVPAVKFADPIITCARSILELRELEKKLDSTTSGDS